MEGGLGSNLAEWKARFLEVTVDQHSVVSSWNKSTAPGL